MQQHTALDNSEKQKAKLEFCRHHRRM